MLSSFFCFSILQVIGILIYPLKDFDVRTEDDEGGRAHEDIVRVIGSIVFNST